MGAKHKHAISREAPSVQCIARVLVAIADYLEILGKLTGQTSICESFSC